MAAKWKWRRSFLKFHSNGKWNESCAGNAIWIFHRRIESEKRRRRQREGFLRLNETSRYLSVAVMIYRNRLKVMKSWKICSLFLLLTVGIFHAWNSLEYFKFILSWILFLRLPVRPNIYVVVWWWLRRVYWIYFPPGFGCDLKWMWQFFTKFFDQLFYIFLISCILDNTL